MVESLTICGVDPTDFVGAAVVKDLNRLIVVTGAYGLGQGGDAQSPRQTSWFEGVKTFFDDSPYLAVNSLLDMSINDLSDQELDRLKAMIQARKKTQNDKK